MNEWVVAGQVGRYCEQPLVEKLGTAPPGVEIRTALREL